MFIGPQPLARWPRITVLALALVAIAGTQASQAMVESGPAATSVNLTIELADLEQAALVEWAASRFNDAGLELPPLGVSFRESRSECAGAAGLLGAVKGP